MKILFVISHYYAEGLGGGKVYASTMASKKNLRLDALKRSISAIRGIQGQAKYTLDWDKFNLKKISEHRSEPPHHEVTLKICTTRGKHLLHDAGIRAPLCDHIETDVEPLLLPFETYAILRSALGDYDYYSMMEDDLILADPFFFDKLAWFNRSFGEDKLLQPNRFELTRGSEFCKLYIDGEFTKSKTVRFQNIRDQPLLRGEFWGRDVEFRRPTNPHSGCFFLTQNQLAIWAERSDFMSRSVAFEGPLESAASLGIMRTFKIYKPTLEINPQFLEIEHANMDYYEKIQDRGRLSGLGNLGKRMRDAFNL